MKTSDTPGNVHIPRLASIRKAVEIYYSHYELNNADICELFQCSGSTAWRIKKLAIAKTREEGILQRTQFAVSTDVAYRAWGLDIEQLEARLRKAEKLGLNV